LPWLQFAKAADVRPYLECPLSSSWAKRLLSRLLCCCLFALGMHLSSVRIILLIDISSAHCWYTPIAGGQNHVGLPAGLKDEGWTLDSHCFQYVTRHQSPLLTTLYHMRGSGGREWLNWNGGMTARRKENTWQRQQTIGGKDSTMMMQRQHITVGKTSHTLFKIRSLQNDTMDSKICPIV
jgi:hypothetical protein